MNITEINTIMSMIEMNYQQQLIKLDGMKFYNNLKLYLHEEDFNLVRSNLIKHIKTSNFLPTIADLLKQPDTYTNVPNALETRLMIEQQEKEMPNAQVDRDLIKEMIRKHREEMGEINYAEYKRRITKFEG